MGAGGTQTQTQPQALEALGMTVNGKPVKNDAELQAALNAIPAGTAVKIVYKVGGQDRTIEGVSK